MRHRTIATLLLCILVTTHTGCVTAVAAFQPEDLGGPTIRITTTDADGETYDRVLTPIDDGDRLFVSANHWPRAWYRRALENPDVRVTRDGATTAYRAVPVDDQERERLLDAFGFPWPFYVLTGFAPREFLRLDPVSPEAP